MNEYEIGRDIEALRCRLERLESKHGSAAIPKAEYAGLASQHATTAGVLAHETPTLWKLDQPIAMPPFLLHLYDGPHRGPQFDVLPESKTWTCHPEPLILFVGWAAGGTDAFYQFQNQLFSVIKFTDPNTGHISCSATYQARRVALGKAVSHYFPPQTGSVHGPGYYNSSYFKIILRGPGGSNIGGYTSTGYAIVDCHESVDIDYSWAINPGIYDLVTGATWEVDGVQTVDRC